MMGNYILNLDRLELLALSDESQMYSGDLVAEMAKSMLQLQKRIAELEFLYQLAQVRIELGDKRIAENETNNLRRKMPDVETGGKS